ncbi:MAG: carboxypeptidase regulatory-like domain-containing protein [Acidobacteriota bacterium]
MRLIRLHTMALALSLTVVAIFFVESMAPAAYSQTNITGAIAGTVTDSTGAIVAGATVTATSLASGRMQSVMTGASGDYRFSQLAPGTYSVRAAAGGFQQAQQNASVSVNSIATVNFSLAVGQASVTVEVSGGEQPLLHVEDAQITTSFNTQQIQNMPNPGNDLTFVAQTAPGSVMNTQSMYGNFSSFGLPGTANTFTVNGGYDNDPFMNISNSGASNLLLGANDIGTETVTTNAYNASFGGLGGAQVSQMSKSGSNQFHGNLAYWWNGRVMNANDYFNKQSGTPRSFDNANQWAGAVGGPVKRDKLFFFFNYEGLKVVIPTRSTVYAPDAAYQAQVLKNLANNGLSSEAAIYQNIFNLYNKAPGFSSATPNYTSQAACAPYCTVKFNGTAGNYTHEWLINPRFDWNISDKDHLFGHGTVDKGVQATYTSVLNPLFNAASAQPSYQGQLGEQHTFSPTLTNQFLTTMNYYVAVFSNATQAQSEQIVPFSLIFANGPMHSNTNASWPGGYNLIWPQGRNVTGYQFQDDLMWTRGTHTFSVGWTMRRNDVTDYSPSEYTTSPEAYTTAKSFQQGYVDLWFEQFPTRPTQPVALYAMGWYVQDEWKALPNLTLTYGLRMEHNSNPICRTNCFAHLTGNFGDVSTTTSTAYNKMIQANLGTAMPSLQAIGWEPRIGFAFLPFGAGSRTTIRGGFGMFADAFPGIIADNLLNNAPSNVPFTVYGPAFGGGNVTLVPTSAGSAHSIAVASNAGFQSAFASGGSLDSISNTVPLFSAPNMTSPTQKIYYPTYEEWSLAVEHQISNSDSFSIMYVGNRSYHGPVLNNGVNIYNAGATGFPELSATAPNPNFASVTQISSSSSSNFNGMVLSYEHRSRTFTMGLNYEYSHALDDISNGGFLQFSGNSINPDNPFNLLQNYGNSDYDTRHYVSANYVYTMPHFWGPKLLVDNWEAAGTVFHSTGLPFSVTDANTASNLTNYGGPLFAMQTGSIKGHTHCGGTGAANGTQCAFASSYGPATNFGQSGRNQLFGPNYTDADLTVTKGFLIPHWETAKIRVGAQFFNLFNHPNFAQPYNDLADGSSMGTITSAVNPPTSILGAFLGGDASPRLIQITGKFDF